MACQGSRIVGDGSSFHSIVVTVKTSSMEIIKAIEEPLQPSINSALKEDGLGGYNVRVKFDNSSHVIAYDGKEYYVELQISYPEKCEEYVEDDKLIQKVIMQKLHDCIDPKFNAFIQEPRIDRKAKA